MYRASSSSVPSRGLCSVAQFLRMGSQWGECAAHVCTLFHRLPILDRATDHKCIKECIYSKKRNVGRIKCNGLVNFFLREEVFQATHAFFPPSLPPHQASTPLLGNPPPPPKAPLFQRRGHLRLWGSDRGVLSIEGWPIRYDSSHWHI